MTATLITILVSSLFVFGGGWLLGRAIRLPHFGLATASMLALWLVITIGYAMPFRWSARVGDIGWVTILICIGFVVWRQRLIQPSNTAINHPTRFRYDAIDIALVMVILLGLSVPALVLPVPLDTDAQGFGYLALTAKLNGNLTSLAPLNPDLEYLYAPGFTVIVAYLSERLSAPLHSVQFGVSAVLGSLFVLVMFDFARELRDQQYGRAVVIALFIGTGFFTAYMDSHFTSVIGLIFGAAFLAFSYRYLMHHRLSDAFAAALHLAALVLVHPDTTIIVGLGFGAWLLLMPLTLPRPRWREWIMLVFAVPLLALLLVLPWFFSVLHLLGGDIASPFERFPHYWRVVLSAPPEMLYHGGVVVLIALIGAIIGLRRRNHAALLSVGWLVLIMDFAALGILERTVPFLVAPITRYDYPFSLAWHGPIIPYALLAGLAIVWAWEKFTPAKKFSRRVAWLILGLITIGILSGGIFNQQILALSKGRITFFGAFASHDDVAAMTWLRENTLPDALILNFPGPQEGDWVPVIAERRAVYYRPQPFFTRDGDPLADTPEQIAMRAFWENPADEANAALLRDAGIAYVIVPQVVGNPASITGHFRWRRPFTELIDMQSAVTDVDYLTKVFDEDGAQVFAVDTGK